MGRWRGWNWVDGEKWGGDEIWSWDGIGETGIGAVEVDIEDTF